MLKTIRSFVRRGIVATAGSIALLACSWPHAVQAAGADAIAARKGGIVARGGDLCGLLGPGDFLAAGVPGAGPPSSNSTPPADYYCVYAGRSSYMGGIEFDAFLADSAADAASIFKTVTKETADPDAIDPAKAMLLHHALLSLKAPGDPRSFASIDVRKGRLVFAIGFPSGPQAEAQLLALARLVLQRGAGLAK